MSSADVKQTIYLFTTTNRGLHKRDLLNVCCFPENWHIEFGYKSDYVPEGLRSRLSDDVEGHPAVIVFCEPIDSGNTYYRYHPVRRGFILKAKRDRTDSVTLKIKLGQVYDYSRSAASNGVDGFQNWVDSSDDRPQTRRNERTSGRAGRFVRSAPSCFSAGEWADWESRWHSLVAYLRGCKGLSDSFFVRPAPATAGLASSHIKPLPDPVPTPDGVARPRWRLLAGNAYGVRFEVRAGSAATPATPNITTSKELVNVLGPFERQSGDGTEVEFIMNARRIFQTDSSMLIARVETDADKKPRSSEVCGELELRPQLWLLPATLVLLVGGSVILSLDSALLEQAFGKPDASRPLWDGRVALWFCKAAGAVLLGVGGYLGFRKLPFKV